MDAPLICQSRSFPRTRDGGVIRGIPFGEPRFQMHALATYESMRILDREANTTRILVFGRWPTSAGAFDQRSLQGQHMESRIDR